MASIQKMANGRYRARYRDSTGKEHLKRFALKRDAQRWLDQESSKLQTGNWVAPRDAKITVAQWCTTWLRAYRTPQAVHGADGRGTHRSDRRGIRSAPA
jgi:hypothetical protein